VAVWCDQLIRSLGEIDFTLVAITGTGREPVVWDLPSNVTRFERVVAWDRIGEARRSRRRHSALPEPLLRLLGTLVAPAGDTSLRSQSAAFSDALDEVMEIAETGRLDPHLCASALLGPTHEALMRSAHIGRRYEPTLADALGVSTAISHLLGPLTTDIGEVDVVHASANGLPMLVALAQRARRGTPVIISEHGLYLRERYLGADRELPRPVMKDVILRFHRLLTVLSYERADHISPASAFNGRWAAALGADPLAVTTLHNGVDPTTFRLRPAEVRSPHVVWLGRIDPVKDLHTLLRSADLVRQRVPAVRFRLFGEEPADVIGYRDSCLALRDELDLRSVVSFEGKVGHPEQAFYRGQISALSSITEGFPYSVLESMSCGVPVVGTEVGGVPEAIADTGIVVSPRDHQAMANGIIRLLTDPTERRRMSIAARSRVESRFGLNQMLMGLDELYRNAGRVIDLRSPDRDPGDTGTSIGTSLPAWAGGLR